MKDTKWLQEYHIELNQLRQKYPLSTSHHLSDEDRKLAYLLIIGLNSNYALFPYEIEWADYHEIPVEVA